jgi:2-dehydro-3-deoxygluconokinase
MDAIAALGEGLIELRPGAAEDELRVGVGGDAANALVMAARLGAPARLGGRVGDDAFGERLLRFWDGAGVDVRWVRRDAGAPTGLYINDPAPDGGHRFTYWRRGSAGGRLEPADVPDAFLDGVGILLVTGVTLSISATAAAAAQDAADRARARGVRVAFVVNHRPALAPDPDLLRACAAAADIVIASVEDAAAVSGVAAALGDADAREVVLTAGGEPAMVRWPDGLKRRHVPAAQVVDAAGAGDALAGAYLAARLAGLAPPAALARGVAAASLSVGRTGCAASYPTADELAAAVGAPA